MPPEIIPAEHLQADDTPTAASRIRDCWLTLTGALLGGLVVFTAVGGWANFN